MACDPPPFLITVRGFKVQGFKVQRFKVQGFKVQRFNVQGFKFQGFRIQVKSEPLIIAKQFSSWRDCKFNV
jgi:hypothetical protein